LLIKTININKTKIWKTKGENVWQFSFASKEDIINMRNYLYKDASYFLNRKRVKFYS